MVLMDQLFGARRQIIPFLLTAGFFVFSVGVVAASSFFFQEAGLPALLPLAIGLLVAIVTGGSLFHNFASYAVTARGLLLRSPIYRNRLLPFESIREIRLMGRDEALGFWSKLHQEQIALATEMDLVGYWKKGRQQGAMLRYCTIQPMQMEVTSGELNVIAHRTWISGHFISVIDSSGERFLLTPEDPEGLLRAVESGR
jgi:hypothetical protein